MAKPKNAKSSSNLKNFYMVLGVLAVVGVAAIAWLVMRGKSGNAAAEPIVVQGTEDPQALVAKAKGISVGNENAPVKMLLFSDYQCPYCGQFASQIAPTITSEFVNTGKLQIVFYDYPLGGAHKYSFLAARAARCAADQDKFWEYHDIIFGRQSDWSFDESMPVKKFLAYGKEIGLDEGKFKKCVESDQYQDLVSANRMLGDRLGVGSTPTLFINGKHIPANTGMNLQALRDLINAEAGGAAPAPAATTVQ